MSAIEMPASAVPIIAYHRVSAAVKNGMNVPPALFRRHMRFLAENGYSPITLDQWCAAVLDGAPLPPKCVMITFDDAWRSQYENALPILRKYGFPATFFAYTSVVGNRSTMTWEQLRALADEGHCIGCHSATHGDLARPFSLETNAQYEQRLKREIVDAKATIEEHLGIPIRHFCYPYGYYNTNVIAHLLRSGYASAVTVNPFVNAVGTPLFQLGRFIIAPWTTAEQLREKLDRMPLAVRNVTPFNGAMRTRPTSNVQAVLPLATELPLTVVRMKWKWRWTESNWEPASRRISCSFDQPLEPGLYPVQVHAWDAESNHYAYAWLFQQSEVDTSRAGLTPADQLSFLDSAEEPL